MSTVQTEQSNMKPIHFVPSIVWFLLILVLISIPGEELPESEFLFSINFDKLVHAGLFGMQVILLCYALNKSNASIAQKKQLYILVTFLSCLWGLGTECIQLYFVHNRTFSWMDFIADSVGALIALPLCFRYLLRKA
ncbi:MAG: VanZ family protein [Ferruginibacter sp.]